MSDLAIVSPPLFQQLQRSVQTISENPAQSRRLFHGRGHCFPGCSYINIDWFAPVVFISLYEAVTAELLQSVKTQLLGLFRECGVAVEGIYVQRRSVRGSPGELLWGELPPTLYANEDGLRYQISLGHRQNIGFFLDMYPGRCWLRERAADKDVLNLFAYTCAFSVVAVDAGARSVVNIDMSRGSLQRGRENHRLNGHDARLRRDVSFLAHDIFRSWGKLAKYGPYDVVIVDPPSMQKGSFNAGKDYARLVRRIEPLLTSEGEVLFCLNSPHLNAAFLQEVIASNATKLDFARRLNHHKDFPEADKSRNLKMLHYRMR